MGLADRLFQREELPRISLADIQAQEQAEAKAEEQVAAVTKPKKEIGLTGTVNWSGRIHHEENADLQFERAYGMPGSTSWGEWERFSKTDPAVVTALEMVAAPLRDAELCVEAPKTPEGEEDEGAKEIAEFVQDNLKEWLEPQWTTFIEQALQCLVYGHSLFEVVLGTRPDERVPGGTAVVLAKLAQRLPQSLKSDGWKVDGEGELETIIQSGMRGGKWETDIPLPAKACMLFTWRREGSNFLGTSALRSVWYLGKIRKRLLQITAVGHEREGLGFPVIKPGDTASLSDAQLEELQELVENIRAHEMAGAVLPKGVDLEWVFSAGANKGHIIDTWQKLGTAILETFHSQQVSLGTNDTGSRAVGSVHEDNLTKFVKGCASVLEAVLNGVGKRPYTGLVAKLVEPNFGPQKRLPKVKLVLKRPEVPLGEMGTAITAFVNAGALHPRLEDENKIRERFGWGSINEDELEQLKAEKQAKAMEIAGMQTSAQGEEDEDEEDGGPKKPPPPGKGKPPPFAKASLASAPIGFAPKRPLKDEEKHLALAEVNDFLDRARDDFEKDAQDLVTEMVAKAVPDIRVAMADGDPSELLQLQLDTVRLEKYLAQFIERARAEGYRQVRAELRKQPAGLLRKRAQGKVGLSIVALKDDDEEKPAPSPEDLAAIDAKVAKLVDSMRERLLARMKSRVIDDVIAEAQNVARAGGDPQEVVQRVVQRALDTRGLRFDASTVLTSSFNLGREQFAQEYGDRIKVMQYSAVLDLNVCGPCAEMDGKQFEFNSEEHLAAIPPFRDCEGREGCRCLLIAIIDKEVAEVPE